MSKMPKLPLSLEEWIEFATSLKYGDECYVFCDDVTGEVIEYVSEDDMTVDPLNIVPFLHPVHTFRYLGLGRGATVEADPKGTQYHLIDEYRDRVMSGDVRIIVYRHLDLSVQNFDNIKDAAERQIGKPYGWGAILGFGFIKLIWNTPLGSLWRNQKWQTPWCDRNNPVCSQGVRLQKDNVKEFYDVMIKKSKWQDNTPQVCLNQTTALTTYVLDTFNSHTLPPELP